MRSLAPSRRLRALGSALGHPSTRIPAPAPAASAGTPDDDTLAALRGGAVANLHAGIPGPFSDADLQFWADNGYVILKNAVPEANTQAVIDDVFQFLDMDQSDPESWYTLADVPDGAKLPHNAGGMVEIYQTQSLWNNRQHPRVAAAFAQLWGTEDLWVSNDRACMKPPMRKDKPDWVRFYHFF